MKDVTLEMDDFGKNKIVKDVEANVQQLYLLLNMNPGDCEDDPEKGIGIRQYRVGLVDEMVPDIKSNIENQVEKYCDFQISDIEIILQNGELVIGIQSPSSGDIIVFTTSEDSILTSVINA